MRNISILFFIFLSITSCELIDLPDEIPSCIEDQIRNEVHRGKRNQDIKPHVDAYLYQGERVYSFDPGSGYYDWLYTVYNEDCEVICELGGFAGVNSCSDFQENAEELGVIWEL